MLEAQSPLLHDDTLYSEASYDETVVLAVARAADICYRTEQIFGQAVQFDACAEFRGGVGRIRQVMHEFGFQLRAELRRLEKRSFSAFPIVADETPEKANWESSLRQVLDIYQEVLDSQLPARTRAMVKRQYLQLKELWDELNRFVQVLQSLIDPSVYKTA